MRQPIAALARAVLVNAGQSSQVDESGNAVNPVLQSEADRSLPPLAGQTNTGDSGGAKDSSSTGTLVIDKIILTPASN